MVSSPDALTTVLVVEDDPTVAELIRAVINEVPTWGAIVAYDARAAMDLLEHVRADVMIVDVMLPGMTGIELLATLRRRANWHDPPVLMTSANVPSQVVERALGPDPYTLFLSKPFDIDELVETVSRALAARSSDRSTDRSTTLPVRRRTKDPPSPSAEVQAS